MTSDDLLIGYRVQLHRLLHEAVEQEATGSGGPAVEPEGELIEVIVQVLDAHSSLVRAQ